MEKNCEIETSIKDIKIEIYNQIRCSEKNSCDTHIVALEIFALLKKYKAKQSDVDDIFRNVKDLIYKYSCI
nr:MAG TPA_asm: hypothetical protein [Caudoviricetes sp.]